MSISIEREDREWFPPAVARFVEAVEAQRVLKVTEFAGAVSVTTSNLFRDAGACQFDSGAPNVDGMVAMLLFQCFRDGVEQGVATFLYGDDEKLTRIEAVAKTITPGGVN